MLRLERVTKIYGGRTVIDSVTLSLEAGRCYHLVAPNGSGKTTLLSVMAGLVRPTSGRVCWGSEVMTASHRRYVGLVLQLPLVYPELTGLENLVLFARLYGRPNPHRLAQTWLERVGLGRAGRQTVRTYSKGMRQRLSLARALLHEPAVLLLDEPYDGLDDEGAAWLTGYVNECLARGAAVFMTTPRAEPLGPTGVVFTLRRGRLEVAA